MSHSAGSALQLWLRTGVSSGAETARLRADGALIPSSLWIVIVSHMRKNEEDVAKRGWMSVRARMRNASAAALEQQVARSVL